MARTSHIFHSCISIILSGVLLSPAWASESPDPRMLPTTTNSTSGSTTTVELHETLYFMTVSDDPLPVSVGQYTVEATEEWLRLKPTRGERFDSILIQAQQVPHDHQLSTELVTWLPSPEDHPDLRPLVLFSSTGVAYEAIGSKSGIWPRGWWSSVKKTAKKVGRGVKRGAKAVGGGVKKGAKAVGRAGKKVGSGIKRGAKYVGGKVKAGAKIGGLHALRRGRRALEKVKGGVNAVGGAAAAVGRKLGVPLPSGPPKPARKPRTTAKDLRCQLHRSNQGVDPCNPRREPKSFDLELAYRWAPVYYQDTASAGIADYLTAIDYDGTWQTNNNWDNLGKFPMRGYAYYSVVDTTSHWYVLYAYYHPRDWATNLPTGRDNLLNEHENDTEGVLTIIRKDGSKYGKLEGMVTYAHFDFYSFTPKGSALKSGKETIDGTLYTSRHNGQQHPLIASEAYGHGIEAWPKVGLTNKKIKWGFPVKIRLSNTMDFKGGDGIVYYPSNPNDQFPDIPKHKNDRFVSYALIDIFGTHGIWNQRSNKQTFVDGVRFVGNKSGSCGGSKYDIQTCSTNVDTAPWGWDDIDDYAKAGEIATDPAKLTKSYFKGLGKFSRTYLNNPYRGVVQKKPRRTMNSKVFQNHKFTKR